MGFAAALEPYRPIFMAVTLAFLGTSFYSTYRRPEGKACAHGSVCSPGTGTRRGAKIPLWILTVAVLGILAFPYLLAATL
jgi:mercuric ion transport protein